MGLKNMFNKLFSSKGEQEEEDNSENITDALFRLTQDKRFLIFINIMKILTFVMIAVILFYLIKEINLLLTSPCELCQDRFGKTCYALNFG